MHLERLKLLNFRNYSSLDIMLDKKMNIIVGDNGQGKTNLLEAIYFLSRGKSFRNPNRDLVSMECEQGIVEGFFERKNLNDSVRIIIDNSESAEKTTVNVNNKKLKSKNDLPSRFLIVDFTPEDLNIVNDGPDKRRRFIDNELLNIKPVHGSILKDYNKILRQRNELLKNMQRDHSLKSTLYIWDEQLVEYGKKLIINRIVFLQKLNRIAKEIHFNLSDKSEELKLYYFSNLIKSNSDIERLSVIFKDRLEENFDNDLKKGYTSIGPHLDDIKININDLDAKTFGSQGQKRTCALSLKLSQTHIIKEETEEDAIVLLDDVMSELDIKRQKKLLESFSRHQIVITSTEINFMNELQSETKKIYNIKGGNLI
jgi:DNA replication and repair protein RecF